MHGRKMIAPVVVTVAMILYYVVYFGFLISALEGVWRFVLGVLPVAFSLATIKVCADRIREIKEGEEDDIGQY